VSNTEYVYATLLLHSAGKEINEESIRKVLQAAGVAIDEVELKRVVAAIKQINIDEVLKQAYGMPVAVAPAVSQTAASQQTQQSKEVKEEKKEEEKKEEISEEQIAEGLSALFG